LIERVERQRKKENEFHIDVLSFRAQRSGVACQAVALREGLEESLTVIFMARIRIIRDVSTHSTSLRARLLLDMTGTN
jgi:hypothetical protein